MAKKKQAVKKRRKKERFQVPRGMKDLLPEDLKYWKAVEKVMGSMLTKFGFQEIRIPVVERTDLFVRGVGEGTDIVDKEMYNFVTPGHDKLSLRPELTAGILRAYLQDGLESWSHPVKLYGYGPVFRYERPQAGRYRMHHQLSCEVLGDEDPAIDGQTIQLAWKILQKLGVKDLVIKINSIGCKECRVEYIKLLKAFYRGKNSKMCKVCRERYKKNPLRLLDCKEDKCQQLANTAPQMIDHLCQDCHKHFKQVLEILDELEYPYLLDSSLVRGLDYYSRTVFEICSEDPEANDASFVGGGRYDGLIKLLGGKDTSGLGFGMGIERLVEELKRIEYKVPAEKSPKVFLVQLGEMGKKKSLRMFADLIDSGVKVAESLGRGSIKAQLKIADRKKAEIALIVGQKEALDGTVIIRDMTSGVQETVDASKVLKEIDKRLKTKKERIVSKLFGRRSKKKKK